LDEVQQLTPAIHQQRVDKILVWWLWLLCLKHEEDEDIDA